MDPFLLKAFVGGAGVALAAGPVGCFMLWHRLAYFGAAVAHAALLGVALGIALRLPPVTGVIVVCAAVGLALGMLQAERRVAGDTLIGILAHGTLAAGLVAVSLMPNVRIDLMGYLFGDILALTWWAAAAIWAAGLALAGLMAWFWRPLLSVTAAPDIARVEGMPVGVLRAGLTLVIAGLIAAGMQVAGILLTVSLLIIPAAAARLLTRTPEGMAAAASALGLAATAGGLAASLAWDLPAGPSIVLTGALFFALALTGSRAVGRAFPAR